MKKLYASILLLLATAAALAQNTIALTSVRAWSN